MERPGEIGSSSAREAGGVAARSRLLVLMFTDLVGSVELKNRLGVATYARLIQRHDELFREVVGGFADAGINKDTGDGFLAHFERVDSAVAAALLFQQALRRELWQPEPVAVRVGLNSGQVELIPDESGAPPKLVGLPVDLAARIMGLALPGQILLSASVFDNARQYLREHPPAPGLEAHHSLEWRAHGAYLFKGQDEPVAVFEVGAAGLAPLAPPPDGDKAHRAVPLEAEATLGWRPAIGLAIPHREGWELVEKVGEGGFGEVWLGRSRRAGSKRIFKFCFDADRLRSFRRELTLFRFLRSELGERPDIARLFDVQLDEAPFFLESEYTELGSLADWAQRQGGIDKVPLATRIDLVARLAVATAAAHNVGVLHKDVKPSNVLIYQAEDGSPRPRLADFGIGLLTTPSRLGELGLTSTGLTETLLADHDSSRTGTRLYAPPELLAGKPFTIQGDVFALGVLLFQMVVGDLGRPLAVGWEGLVPDPLLREDVRACVEGDPEQRLGSAQELAERLFHLEERRRARQLAERRRRRGLALRWGLGLAAAAALAAGLGWRWEQGRRRAVEQQRDRAARVTGFLQQMLSSPDPRQGIARDVSVEVALEHWAEEADRSFEEQPNAAVEAAVRETLGLAWKSLGRFGQAEKALRRALALTQDGEPPELARARLNLGVVLLEKGELGEETGALLGGALELSRSLKPAAPSLVAESANALGGWKVRSGHLEEAEPLLAEAVELSAEKGGDGREAALRRGLYLSDLGLLHQKLGRLEAAEKELRQATAILSGAAPQHPDTATAVHNLAVVLEQQGRLGEAEPLMRQALALRREAYGRDHPEVANSLSNLGRLLSEQAGEGGPRAETQEAEAERSLAEAEAIFARAFHQPTEDAAITLSLHAQLLAERGSRLARKEDLSRAGGLFEQAEGAFRALPGSGGEALAGTLLNHAALLRGEAQLARTPLPLARLEALLREAVELYRREPEGAQEGLAPALQSLAALRRRQGDCAGALPLVEEALRLFTRASPPAAGALAAARSERGACLLRLGRFEPAEQDLRAAAAALEGDAQARARCRLLALYRAQARAADAAALSRELSPAGAVEALCQELER